MSKLSKNFRQTLLQKINIKSDIHSLFPYANLFKLFTSKTANYVKPTSSLYYNEDPLEETFPILNLPNEVIGYIFEFLDVIDIIRCENSSKHLFEIIIHMNIYKRILDRECKVKANDGNRILWIVRLTQNFIGDQYQLSDMFDKMSPFLFENDWQHFKLK